ncbi:MAG: hypothetical protein A3A65_05700 [Candidatus Chisholmbacteria bacterium RIFCSPLOWO2_01_FULL_49_14]|uniref:Glycosyltransferase RgtA/B/C/D-like domain-containing protein n=1 Tax=Candidatus Chisholmbacteria bacterium RIFCSPLOWO2_01_FULL_49_14 TaxID=1797593 RepID=A0A1G1W1R4_9BACT|nr:MAG: hypothetical protein A3A65_05700 [Candidatus Chisholmbacteria bacterium RIFCSPLOWO2_01_FULL_49_14]
MEEAAEKKSEQGKGQEADQKKEERQPSPLRNGTLSKISDRLLLAGLLVGNVLLVWRYFSSPFTYVFSAPVVPILASMLGFAGVEYDVAIHWILIAFFIAGPLTLYLFVKELSGRKSSAFISAILYSLPVFRSRFEALTVSGDGAHIAALTLVPLAAFFLMRFLKKGSFPAAIAASIAVLLVALTSPFGLFILLSVMLVVTFSEMLLGTGRVRFLRFVLILMISGGLSAFWYNPEFVRLSLVSTPGMAVIAAIKNLVPLSFFILPVLGTFGFLIFDKRAHLQPLFVALGLTFLFGLISFAGGLARFAVSTQSRYLPEVSFSLSILWGVVGVFVYDLLGYLPQSKWFPIPVARRKMLKQGVLVVFFLTIIILAVVVPYREAISGRSGRVITGASESVVIDIGEIRERTGGVHRILGYVITSLTAVATTGLYFRLRKEEKQV